MSTERISLVNRAKLLALQQRGRNTLREVAEAAEAKGQEPKAQPAPRKRKSSAPPSAIFVVAFPRSENEAVFVLPLPPKQVSPNWRGYWMAKAKAVKAYRQQCGQLMRQSDQSPFQGRVVIDLEFYLCRVQNDMASYYPKDEDNARAAMKSAQDALKDVGMISGDGKKYVRAGSTTLYTKASEHQRLTCVVMRVRPENEAK